MKSERVTAVAWAWSSSMRTFRVALSCFLLVQFGLPVWADGSPSLQDLIKGTAPPLPLEEQKSGDNLPELPQTLPASTINPPASNIPGGFSSGKAPLQGEVDALDAAPSPSTLKLKTLEAMPAPVLPKKPLQAVIQTRQMNSSAEDDDEDLKGLKPSLGSMDQQRNLKSGASMDDLNKGLASEDPDVEDQEMMVQWDKWHNRVLNAIQQGLMEQLQSTGENLMFYDPRTGRMRSKYPLGTMAMFSCQVTPDHHVVIQITIAPCIKRLKF